MPVATIIAAKVFQPKPNKKRGTVVTPDEVLYGAMPPILAKIKQGGQYEVTYTEDHFQGKTYLVIDAVKELAAPAPVAAPVASKSYGTQDLATAERIFVCGALNSTLNNPNFNVAGLQQGELTALVNMFRNTWDSTFGLKSGDAEMSDRVPF